MAPAATGLTASSPTGTCSVSGIIIDCDLDGDQWRGVNLSIVTHQLLITKDASIINLSGSKDVTPD